MTVRDRLENWAEAAWWGMGGYGGAVIGSIEGRYRPERPKEDADASRKIRPEPDFKDADLVDAAWKTLPPKYKWLLKFLYVNNASVSFICRRLNIKHRPASMFDLERVRAEAALQSRIGADSTARSTTNPPADLKTTTNRLK